MDAGIADTINRRDVKLIAERLDQVDAERLDQVDADGRGFKDFRWYNSAVGDCLMGESSSRAWVVTPLARHTPGVTFDGEPADGDWDNLFSYFRAEILARRDPETPPVQAQPLCGMV